MSTLAAVYFTFEIHHDSINFKWSGFNDKLIHFM